MPFPIVYYDQGSLGYIAANHLLETGYRRLLFFSPFSENSGDRTWIDKRYNGIQMACRQWELPVTDLLRYPACPSLTLGRFCELLSDRSRLGKLLAEQLDEGITQLVRGKDDEGISAIITPNDHVALFVQEAITAHGYRVGKDVGIMGFDDAMTALMHGLSSVRPPWEKLGESAVHLTLRALAGEVLPIKNAVGAMVVTRQSTIRM